MGIIKQVFPQCDKCLETYPDVLFETIGDCRANMKKDGWIFKRNGDTICPIHQLDTLTKPETEQQKGN